MTAQDVFQQLEDVDEATAQVIIDRLEMRGRDEHFVSMRDEYVDQLRLGDDARVLELGCGTGVVARALASRPNFTGMVIGTDYSAALVDAARRFAAAEGLENKTEFVIEDAQASDQPDDGFDAVILHTLVSHIPDPAKAIGEAARTVRPGHPVAVFDGDYASLTFATGQADDAVVARAVLDTVVANPNVMREMPALVSGAGLSIDEVQPSVRVEVGDWAFFKSMVESYVPMAAQAGIIDFDRGQSWLRQADEAQAAGRAFASCNYISYIAR